MKPFLLLISLLLSVPAWAQNPVTVRVLDAKNAPVAGANVGVSIWKDDSDDSEHDQTTGADGAATFSVPAATDGKAAIGHISVVAKGFAFNSAPLTGENIEIHLEPGVTWRGHVTGEAGKPIIGAVVSVICAALGKDRQHQICLASEKNSAFYITKTGADGGFAIADVPAKSELLLTVEHPSCTFKKEWGISTGSEANIELAPGGALRVRVLDVDGKPIAGAEVGVHSPQSDRRSDKTDENGVFVIASLAAGTYSVDINEDADLLFPLVADVQVEAGKTLDVPDIRAVAGVVIKGTVRDAETKKPLAGAILIAQNQDNTSSSSGESDAEGHFTFRVLAGNYKVYMGRPPAGYLRPDELKSVVASETAKNEDIVFDLQKATL